MARKIIFLERQGMPSEDRTYRIAFWLTVPATRVRFYANPNATSAFRDITDEELATIRAGEVVEVVDALTAPAGASDEQAFTMLQGSYARRQQELVDRNPFDNYGTSWAGDDWTRVTVA